MFLIVVVVIQLYLFVKMYRSMHSKKVNFIP